MSWQYKWCIEVKPAPAIIILLGAGGDLARKKLFPAYARLAASGLWPEGSRIIGCARREWHDEDFRQYAAASMPEDGASVTEDLCFVPGDAADPVFAQSLQKKIQSLLQDWQGAMPPSLIYHFAMAPEQTIAAVQNLGNAGLFREKTGCGAIRALFEKPFGFSGADSGKMNDIIGKFLQEEQIYRTDHYLGKDTIRNIMVTRFCNRIFEPAWSSEHIEKIMICAPETGDVSARSSYYDRSGCIRDMFQNHLLEMLALTAMDMPASPGMEALTESKTALLKDVRVRKISTGRYTGYSDHPGVARGSLTETAACALLNIDSPRWRGSDFILFSGKGMNTGQTSIKVIFRQPERSIFPLVKASDFSGNILTIEIQPEAKMLLAVQVKRPGPNLCMGTAEMSFSFPAGENMHGLDAYARLLTEAMLGDRSTFVSREMIEAGWKIFDPVIAELRQKRIQPAAYPAGSAPEDIFSELIL